MSKYAHVPSATSSGAVVPAQREADGASRERRRDKARSYVSWLSANDRAELDDLDGVTADASLRGGEW